MGSKNIEMGAKRCSIKMKSYSNSGPSCQKNLKVPQRKWSTESPIFYLGYWITYQRENIFRALREKGQENSTDKAQ
jgi:hypothetical protein